MNVWTLEGRLSELFYASCNVYPSMSLACLLVILQDSSFHNFLSQPMTMSSPRAVALVISDTVIVSVTYLLMYYQSQLYTVKSTHTHTRAVLGRCTGACWFRFCFGFLCIFCFLSWVCLLLLCVVYFLCVRWSVPVQLIAWKNLSLQ